MIWKVFMVLDRNYLNFWYTHKTSIAISNEQNPRIINFFWKSIGWQRLIDTNDKTVFLPDMQ